MPGFGHGLALDSYMAIRDKPLEARAADVWLRFGEALIEPPARLYRDMQRLRMRHGDDRSDSRRRD
jgi:hypothetical protein